MFPQTKQRPGRVADPRSVLGQIRKMLREQSTIEREEIRARLRASRRIGMDGFGGRRVYLVVKYLRRRGEVIYTPTHVTAIALLEVGGPRRPTGNGMRAERIRLAEKRARAVARRQVGLVSRGCRQIRQA